MIRTIHQDHHHFGWDNDLQPVERVEPGTELSFGILEASGGQLTQQSTADDVAALEFSRVNPVTGPIHVDGAEPGDTLVVDILAFEPSGWGWTALIPDFGLLSDDFVDPFLHISMYDDSLVQFAPGIRIPVRPFPGTIGVALAEPGTHTVVPPRRVGGNVDIRDLVAGSRLYLPVEVEGAMFSVGDTHACQGDGEVCGTAVESPMTMQLKLDLRKGEAPMAPRFDVPGPTRGAEAKHGYRATTGVAPDLMDAAKDASDR